MTEALPPIARALRDVEGNYTRTMCESIYPILLAYERRAAGHAAWLEAGERFGEFLLRTQGADGSWHRAYAPDGIAVTEPREWFGASDARAQERHASSRSRCWPLLHRLTGDERYARRPSGPGTSSSRPTSTTVEYVGGLNDTTHVKSVKTDSVGVMFAMRSLLKLYRADRRRAATSHGARAPPHDPRVLGLPVGRARSPRDRCSAPQGFATTGWAVCDVLPGGSYIDNELLEFTGDLIAVAARERRGAPLRHRRGASSSACRALSMPGRDARLRRTPASSARAC